MKYQTISDSIGFVFHNSEFVSVDEERIDLFTASFQATDVVHWSESALFEYENLDFDEEIDFRFLVDTQAFYFWGAIGAKLKSIAFNLQANSGN